MSKPLSRTNYIFLRIYFYLIFAIAFGVLLFVYPKQGKFKYEYQKGMPWKHETLIASFDFPIQKTKDEIQNEKDSLLNYFYPYFVKNNKVAEAQLERFSETLNQTFENKKLNLDEEQQQLVREVTGGLLLDIYKNGIVSSSVEFKKQSEGKEKIQMVSENIASEVDANSVYSLKSAYLILSEEIAREAETNTFLSNVLLDLDLSDYLESNLVYDEEWTNRVQSDIVESISNTRGMVQAGVRIISRGDFVSDDDFLLLESYRKAYESQKQYGGWLSLRFIAQMFLTLGIMLLVIAYLKSFNNKVFARKKNLTFILSVMVVFVIAGRLVSDSELVSVYLIPFCILPILIRTFLGARMAIFIHLITMIMVGFMVPNGFEFIVIQFIAGSIAVMMLSRLHRRGHLIIASGTLMVVYALLHISFALMKEGSFLAVDWYELRWFAGNGLLLLIAYPLIYVFEKLFGFISDVTLMEFSDTNHPLLRKLAQEAPGTFQHSMQVANIAEEAILQIGGNPMLVRAGALYHDVGKIADSNLFIENQQAGQNPHDNLDNLQSANIIVGHVEKGVALAKKYNVPSKIVDFIRTHHGVGVATYFYRKHKEENPGKDIDKKQFTYPGPKPLTRETAVVMLADTVEAATRSLEKKNEEVLRDMINMLIDSKVDNHELDDAPLTFRDIKRIKEIFLEKLKNIYHVRIAYPKEKK